jgi:hypothetical protein
MSRAVETDTSNQVGAGAYTATVAPASTSWEVIDVLAVFPLALTTSEAFTVSLDSGEAANYDGIMYSATPTTGLAGATVKFDINQRLAAGDAVKLDFPNSDSKNVYVTVRYDTSPTD